MSLPEIFKFEPLLPPDLSKVPLDKILEAMEITGNRISESKVLSIEFLKLAHVISNQEAEELLAKTKKDTNNGNA